MPRDRDHAPGYIPNSAYSQEDWDEVSDNPPIEPSEFEGAVPFAAAFPEAYAALKRTRGPQKEPTKQLVSLRLSREVLEYFRASGPGWQRRIDEALRAEMKRRP